MRRMLVLPGFVLVGVLAIAPAAEARNSEAVECNGSATGLAIRGDLAVPPGGVCRLVDSTVRGDVRVRGNAYFQATNTTVRGDVRGKRAETIFIEGGSTVKGDVDADRTAQVFVFASTIGGRIDVARAAERVNVCGNTVQRGIAVKRSGRDILVGDPLAVGCPGNLVKRGDIEAEDNSTDVELVVRGNKVSRGDLAVKRNSGPGAKLVEANIGGGRLVCNGNGTPFNASGNTGWNKRAGQCRKP